MTYAAAFLFLNFICNTPRSSQLSASAVSLSLGVRRDCSGAFLQVLVRRRLSGISRGGLLVDGA